MASLDRPHEEQIVRALRYVASGPTIFEYGHWCSLDDAQVLLDRGLVEWNDGNGVRITELGRLAMLAELPADAEARKERP